MSLPPSIDQAVELAIQHHGRGELAQAEAIYRQVLQRQPNHPRALHFLGVIAHQCGRDAAALELIDRSIALRPDEAHYHSNRSEVLRALGRPREAVAALRKALSLKRDDPDFVSNLGVALLDCGEVAEAEPTLRRAVELNDRIPEPHIHISRLLRARGQNEEALAEAQRAIELAPSHLNATLNLALTLLPAGRIDEAEQQCRRGLEMAPNSFSAYGALGDVLGKAERHDESAAAYRRAIEHNPNYAAAHSGLASTLSAMGQRDAAIASFSRALELRPGDHNIHNNAGLTYLAARRYDEAVTAFNAAIRIAGDVPDYLNNLAAALDGLGRFDESTELLKRAVTLSPPVSAALNNLGKHLTVAGRVAEAIPYFRQAIELSPEDGRIYDNLLLALHYLPDLSPGELFAEHLEWAKRFAQPLASQIGAHSNDRDLNRRLKIGYVSADFAAHSVADFIEPILSNHDKSRFEVFCYSDVQVADPYTQRIRQYPDVWTDISTWKDERVTEVIREHQIDLLIDLAGHTARNRMLVFARKPAPVQVTYLGYPDTTGQTAIDWRIADPAADPLGTTESLHAEALYRLPRTFLCYRPFDDCPDFGPLPVDSAGFVTFASFNNLSKVTPVVIEAWSRILLGVPKSRMLVKASALEGMARTRLIDLFASHGIGEDRVDLVGRVVEFRDHLSLYNKVDVALDTFPYHGTTTTCEALWMGVAVVTLVGQVHMSRVGLSLLGQVGLSDLAAEDVEQYVKVAVELADNTARLRELRLNLRERMKQSPLLDSAGVTREIEAAYRAMWQKWVTT